ncbi:MAG: dihydrofolate reductase [Ignavibacteriae bacterium]|nr:dihydrofolate reductase [Ignavibacteriota bacterium]
MKNKKVKKIIITAIAQNGIIGSKGKLPWDIKEELKHFKETTKGSPVLFGRITFESFGKPLKDRLNIVISKTFSKSKMRENVLSFSSLKKANEFLEENDYEKVFICGGRNIYKAELDKSDEMIISWMKFFAEGDTKFPEINFNNWEISGRKDYKEFEVVYYKSKKKPKI